MCLVLLLLLFFSEQSLVLLLLNINKILCGPVTAKTMQFARLATAFVATLRLMGCILPLAWCGDRACLSAFYIMMKDSKINSSNQNKRIYFKVNLSV